MSFNPRAYTRQISTEAYKAALSTGLISAKRRSVFDYIFQHAPCCQAEAVRDLSTGNTNDGVVTTRFSELEDMDAIVIVGKAPSVVNPKQIVGYYDITGRAKPLKKPPPMFMLWSDLSGYLGFTSRERSDLLPYLRDWFRKGFSDAKIVNISVRKR